MNTNVVSLTTPTRPQLGSVEKRVKEDPIFELLEQYRQDSRVDKIDLGIGVYRDHLNRSTVFEAIKAAEQWRVDTEEDKAYIGPLGDVSFCQAIAELAMGDDLANQFSDRLAYAQTPGGVGALRLAFELVAEVKSQRADPKSSAVTLWVSDTTWQVHRPIAEAAGLTLKEYSYYDASGGSVRFEAMLASLDNAQTGDVVLLQASCHNPTGLDLSEAQWRVVARYCADKGLLPIVDMAYHGLGGGLDADRQGLRIMAAHLPELLLCYTCSKNFGLYRDRTGMVMSLAANVARRDVIEKQWMQLATRHYFTPPAHGASLVRHILSDETLRQLWTHELETIASRLRLVREQLYKKLRVVESDRNWKFLIEGRGMFALFPLSKAEIRQLRSEHGLYIVDNGRVNLSGINEANFSRVLGAIASVIAVPAGVKER